MHGAGNKFLIHTGNEDPAKLIKNLQGADGLLVLSVDVEADLYMTVYNADGNEVQQCGNGLRCAALHALRSKLVPCEEISIRTVAGINMCRVHLDRNEIEVSIGTPSVGPEQCGVDQGAIADLPSMQFVCMGNPNAVMWTEQDPVEVRGEYGKLVCEHAGFAQGINLHVARLDQDNHATVASWERGVGPTPASGTGGAAVFVSTTRRNPFVVSSLGGSLSYHFADDGQVVMTGPAAYV